MQLLYCMLRSVVDSLMPQVPLPGCHPDCCTPHPCCRPDCCMCTPRRSGEFWIQCDSCDRWFDGDCVGMTAKMAEQQPQWKCPLC